MSSNGSPNPNSSTSSENYNKNLEDTLLANIQISIKQTINLTIIWNKSSLWEANPKAPNLPLLPTSASKTSLKHSNTSNISTLNVYKKINSTW